MRFLFLRDNGLNESLGVMNVSAAIKAAGHPCNMLIDAEETDLMACAEELNPMGGFLDVARKEGWETHGVEISEYASAYARDIFGLKVITGDLQEANFPNGYFDVATVNFVLEHLSNPKNFLWEVSC